MFDPTRLRSNQLTMHGKKEEREEFKKMFWVNCKICRVIKGDIFSLLIIQDGNWSHYLSNFCELKTQFLKIEFFVGKSHMIDT